MSDDSISRQAVIDLVEELETQRLKGDIGLLYAPMIKGVRALPSAQPEIIRCKDCKYAEVADQEDSQDGYTCQFHRGSIWFSGCYCSWAERRQDE